MIVSTFVFADAANSTHKSIPSLGTQVSEEADEAGERRHGAGDAVSNEFLDRELVPLLVAEDQ